MKKREIEKFLDLDGNRNLELSREMTIQRMIATNLFDAKTGKVKDIDPDLGLGNETLELAYKKFKRKSKSWQTMVARLAGVA